MRLPVCGVGGAGCVGGEWERLIHIPISFGCCCLQTSGKKRGEYRAMLSKRCAWGSPDCSDFKFYDACVERVDDNAAALDRLRCSCWIYDIKCI